MSTLASPAVCSVAQTRAAPVARPDGAVGRPPIVDVARVRASIRVIVPEPPFATHAALESRAIAPGSRPTGTASRAFPLPGSTTATLSTGTRTAERPPPRLVARTVAPTTAARPTTA